MKKISFKFYKIPWETDQPVKITAIPDIGIYRNDPAKFYICWLGFALIVYYGS